MENIKILNPWVLDTLADVGRAINSGVSAKLIDELAMKYVDEFCEKLHLNYEDRASLMYATKNINEQVCELAWLARQKKEEN